MSKMRGQERSPFALCMVMVIVLVGSPSAFALNPKLDVSQYAHTAWKIREGFTKSRINAITQTTDGYLWLGTDLGLLRFDGVRIVPWQPPPGQHLPANDIWSLAGGRDGTLWIGTTNGLASWKDGKLTQYDELSGRFIPDILEDRGGAVWASGIQAPNGRLCAIQNGVAHCYGDDGSLGRGVYRLYEDPKGNLWARVGEGLWHWKPGTSEFFPVPGIGEGGALAEAADGALLLSRRPGIGQVVNGKIQPYPLPGTTQEFRVFRMIRDRDGALWIATEDHGLIHVHQGKTDVFGQANGLSGNFAISVLEDREGSIWVVTTTGLDRFRELVVTTSSKDQSGSNLVWSVLAAKDGSVWLSSMRSLDRWNNGQITSFGDASTHFKNASVFDGKLNGDAPNSLFQDSRGRIWASTVHGFGYLQDDRFVALPTLPGGAVHSIAEDNTGNLWVANQDHGLFRISTDGEVLQIPWAGLRERDLAYSLIGDPVRGGIWIGFFRGGVSYFADGTIRESYGSSHGLGEGIVHTLRFDQNGTLWAATAGGLSRFKNGRFSTLTTKNGLPCENVHWMIEDDDHSVWLDTACGLAQIARSEFDAWITAADRGQDPNQKIHTTIFDSSDGVSISSYPSGFRPLVGKSPDGRLWFTNYQGGASILDPRHIPFNKIPPPVHIEQITANHKTYDVASSGNGNVWLPPTIRDLEIDYTALSLVAPEKVLFRYKLEGWDRDWQEAGTRRQAFYANLPPRNYIFRVTACNNSGVWNEAGTFLNFSVAPAYYQTLWFRSLCALAFLSLLAAFYQWRLRQVARQFNLRLEGRVGERTRIARELHDTLLQSFQGVLMKLHAITYSRDLDETQHTLKSVIKEARQAITEGRDAVQGLRSSTVVTNDLAEALNLLGKELAAQSDGNRPEFSVEIQGTPRDLVPLLRDEVCRITSEALRNAFRHARARRIEVEIRYDQRQLRLRVRDNGKGIDSEVLKAGGRVGHYGLPSMHERAKLIGGKLAVWSELDSGTETELTIPASIAYAKSEAGSRFKFWTKGA